MTDKAIICLLQAESDKDRSAGIKQLILKFDSMVRAYVLQNSGQEADVESHRMAVAFALYEAVNKKGFVLNENTKLRTFYYSICQNLWLKKIRGKRPHQPLSVLDSQLDKLLYSPNPIHDLIDLETQAELGQLMGQLCSGCQTILVYQYFKNHDFVSIAERLGMNTQSARNKAVKCRARLKNLILENERLRAYFKSYIRHEH